MSTRPNNGTPARTGLPPSTLRPNAPPAPPPFEPWLARPRRWLTIVACDDWSLAPTVTVDGWDAAFEVLSSWRYRKQGVMRVEDQDGRTVATAVVDDGGTATLMVRV
jgi:hypothetical protein